VGRSPPARNRFRSRVDLQDWRNASLVKRADCRRWFLFRLSRHSRTRSHPALDCEFLRAILDVNLANTQNSTRLDPGIHSALTAQSFITIVMVIIKDSDR